MALALRFHVDHKPIAHVFVHHAVVGRVDLGRLNHLHIRRDVPRRAEVDDLLSLGDAADDGASKCTPSESELRP